MRFTTIVIFFVTISLYFFTSCGDDEAYHWNKNVNPVDNNFPIVSILYPTADRSRIIGPTQLRIIGASSDEGGTVELIEVMIDDGNWSEATGLDSWHFDWDMSGVEYGVHTITARSTDDIGASSTAEITISYINSAAPDDNGFVFVDRSAVIVQNETIGDAGVNVISALANTPILPDSIVVSGIDLVDTDNSDGTGELSGADVVEDVVGEVLSNTVVDVADTLIYTNIIPGTVVIKEDADIVGTDGDGTGFISGAGITVPGTINYVTGVISFSLDSAPSGTIYADYSPTRSINYETGEIIFSLFIDTGSPVTANYEFTGGAGLSTDPYGTIMQGITKAKTDGKNVCVAQQTYYVDSSLSTAVVMEEGVSIFGGYQNDSHVWTRDVDAYPAIITNNSITGGSWNEPASAVYYTKNGVDIIDGFEINGGSGNYTAAIFIKDGTPTISNNKLNGGSARISGGLNDGDGRSYGIFCAESEAAICGNEIDGASGTTSDNSYGIYLNNSPARVFGNIAITGGNAVTNSYAIYCFKEKPYIINNSEIAGGGDSAVNTFGIFCRKSSPTISNNIYGKVKNENIPNTETDIVDENLAKLYIKSGTIVIKVGNAGVGSDIDNGDGTGIIAGLGIEGTGSINYTNGLINFILSEDPGSDSVTADYNYEAEIKGGKGAFESYGIYCSNEADAIISGNRIDGGNSAGDSHCIYIENISAPELSSNTLLAEGGTNRYGVYEGMMRNVDEDLINTGDPALEINDTLLGKPVEPGTVLIKVDSVNVVFDTDNGDGTGAITGAGIDMTGVINYITGQIFFKLGVNEYPDPDSVTASYFYANSEPAIIINNSFSDTLSIFYRDFSFGIEHLCSTTEGDGIENLNNLDDISKWGATIAPNTGVTDGNTTLVTP